MSDIPIDWLLKVAKAKIKSGEAQLFISKLSNKQYTFDELTKLAEDMYVETAKQNGLSTHISYSDLEIFTSLLIALVYEKNNLPSATQEGCIKTLSESVPGFINFNNGAKNRLAKLIIEATTNINN